MTADKKTAAVYIRVSTDAQREEGYSIDAQKEMSAAYLKSKNIKKFEYYIDGGYTGSNMERPALKQLISHVKEKKINLVLVYKLDRLSRSQKDTLYLIEDIFNPNDVQFISMNESMDTSTPLGRLMLGILSAFAQLERENIKERTRMGMKERVKTGLWMGGGRIPFGYDYDKKKGILVPNSDAQTVRKAYDLYLKGYSTQKIANILGLKYEKLAYQILRRKSNAGYIFYNGEYYKGQHDAIISEETYDRTMKLMESRSFARGTNPQYILSGLIVCGVCGAKMRYQKWGKDKCKIVCYSQDKSKKHLIHDPNCDNDRTDSEKLEDIVIKDIFSFSLNNEKKASGETFMSLKEIYENNKKDAETRLKRLYNLYSRSGNDVLLKSIDELTEELEKINKKIEEQKQTGAKNQDKENLRKALFGISDTWKYMTNMEKRNIIINIVEKIVVTNENVDIYYKI